MRKTLVIVGGGVNALFVLFHLLLGRELHRMPGLEGVRALLETFNGIGALEIAFFAAVSLAYPDELLSTRVGRSAIALIVLTYAGRALAEIILFPRIRPVIVVACLITAAIYAVAVLLRGPRTTARAA